MKYLLLILLCSNVNAGIVEDNIIECGFKNDKEFYAVGILQGINCFKINSDICSIAETAGGSCLTQEEFDQYELVEE